MASRKATGLMVKSVLYLLFAKQVFSYRGQSKILKEINFFWRSMDEELWYREEENWSTNRNPGRECVCMCAGGYELRQDVI